MSVINTTTKAKFTENITASDGVVLVDFWAEWCPPCVAMSPVLEALADKHKNLTVVKVNIEESPDNAQLATEHGVSSIPNMFIYKNGHQVKNIVGLRPAPALEAELQEFFD